MWGEPRRLYRIALLLWLLLGLVAWNVVFDRGIDVASARYLAREYDQRMHGKPGLRIDDVMRPAVRASARRATLVGGGLAVVGIGLLEFARRRAKRQRDTVPPGK